MTSEELLRLLRSHWTTVVTGLDDDDLDRVSGALRELREETAAGDPVAVARAVRRLKRTLAALPPGHPVSEAVGGHRYAAATRELPGLGTIDAVISVLGTDSAALLRTARRRLLAAPALTEAERAALTGSAHARPAGTEHAEPPGAGHAAPPDAGLIRLRDPDRGIRYPRFQFRPGTAEPLPVVRRINTLLRADRDPWGAADWWLGGNRWLGGVPADLLGVLPDEALERAAAELVGAL
ncbi:hypothetical protein KBP30_08750 [Streptomyces sp. Go40/10]|uniref:hypothetical protein n=1 Tax=Streptomyces sp. Go40/10 TaxID=2825844 RepID=UPI001E4E443B|nr:hypothetical protein [Streptomyces sp. Go40/10]UFR01261.1 hypothetical protein KBP30_08750 [Streptomyces sp. Go40/10]